MSWHSVDRLVQNAQVLTVTAPDGGGVRGYWSLLLLEKLIEEIAYIEQRLDENIDVDEAVGHSFHPEKYPKNVSQNLSSHERQQMKAAKKNSTKKFEVLQNCRRYLPCHYFDYICGSSTGS